MSIKLRYVLPLVFAATVVVPKIASANAVVHREMAQEHQIFDGVRAGEVTPLEFRHLEQREQAINNQRIDDAQANGGYLTPQEQEHFSNRLNDLSESIHLDAAPPTSRIYQTEIDQQNRIGAGLQDHQINLNQFRTLEKHELSVNDQRLADLNANNGQLTTQAYQQLGERLNHISNAIHHLRQG